MTTTPRPHRLVLPTPRPVPARRRPHRVAIVGLVALALLAAACGTDEPDPVGQATGGVTSGAGSSAATSTTGSSTSVGSTLEPTTTAGTATKAEVSTTVPVGPTTLAGDPFDGFPRAGDELLVVGVAHDDVLNARSGPGTDQPIVGELAPTAEGVVATGRARRLSRTIWYEVDLGSSLAWVNSAYVAFGGSTDDITSEVVAAAGARPGAETMIDLGTEVAELRSSDDVDSRIVLSVAPTVGDLGEVTFDVIGLADDSLYGERLHIFARQDENGEGFSLVSVERRDLCGRGLSATGLCV